MILAPSGATSSEYAAPTELGNGVGSDSTKISHLRCCDLVKRHGFLQGEANDDFMATNWGEVFHRYLNY